MSESGIGDEFKAPVSLQNWEEGTTNAEKIPNDTRQQITEGEHLRIPEPKQSEVQNNQNENTGRLSGDITEEQAQR